VTKDLKVRYKNSALGFLWSLLNPLLMMLVYTLVFTRIFPTGVTNFPIFVLIGLLPWNWCQRGLSSAATSLLDNRTIITKVYFPRVLLPVSAVISEGVNFLLALPVLFALMFYLGAPFTPWIAYIPVLILIQAMLLIGLGLFLAGLNVIFRDTGVILEVVLLAWFFLTPVFYDIKRTYPDTAAWVFRFNPMASIIEQYRTILYEGGQPGFFFDIRAGLTCFVILVLGYLFFMSLNRRLGEHL
jgi:ABC-type polysaccharide/polyol phosphate export permease